MGVYAGEVDGYIFQKRFSCVCTKVDGVYFVL